MDINITEFLKVWFQTAGGKLQRISCTTHKPYTLVLPTDIEFSFAATLPCCIIHGVKWMLVGHNSRGEMVGLDVVSAAIRPIPFKPIPDEEWIGVEDWDVYFIAIVSLTSPRDGYSVVFPPFEQSLVFGGVFMYYTIFFVSPEGERLPLKLILGDRRSSPVNVEDFFTDYHLSLMFDKLAIA